MRSLRLSGLLPSRRSEDTPSLLSAPALQPARRDPEALAMELYCENSLEFPREYSQALQLDSLMVGETHGNTAHAGPARRLPMSKQDPKPSAPGFG